MLAFCRVTLFSFFLLLTTSVLHAQTKPWAVYTVLNTVTGRISTQTWMVKPFDNNLGYQLRKSSTQGSAIETSETKWFRITFSTNEIAYIKENFVVSPTELLPGTSSFGSMMLHDENTHEVIEAWPLFFSVTEKDSIRTAEFTVFMNDRNRLVIQRSYIDGEYYFPIEEIQTLYDPKEKIIQQFIFKK